MTETPAKSTRLRNIIIAVVVAAVVFFTPFIPVTGQACPGCVEGTPIEQCECYDYTEFSSLFRLADRAIFH
jgi:hypothetical protein